MDVMLPETFFCGNWFNISEKHRMMSFFFSGLIQLQSAGQAWKTNMEDKVMVKNEA